MRCPTCNDLRLAMNDRPGIGIDNRPHGRGARLDGGELDRLIERAGQPGAPALPSAPPHDRDERARHRGDRHHGDGPDHRTKRRTSMLGELFDF